VIPTLDKEIEAYHRHNFKEAPWPVTKHFANIPLNVIEKMDESVKRSVRSKIVHAHELWRKGEKIPRVYPNQFEWPTVPEELTNHLQYALILHQVQGIKSQKLDTKYFIDYRSHEAFLSKLNEYALLHKYITTAPRPRWNLPSHYQRDGMIEVVAEKAALMYRAEAEMLLYDLLNIGTQRTNQTLIEDPDLLYCLRNDLWKVNEDIETKGSSSKSKVENITAPSVNDPQFKEVVQELSKLPQEHRNILAGSMGFSQKGRKSPKPTDIQIPVYLPSKVNE